MTTIDTQTMTTENRIKDVSGDVDPYFLDVSDVEGIAFWTSHSGNREEASICLIGQRAHGWTNLTFTREQAAYVADRLNRWACPEPEPAPSRWERLRAWLFASEDDR